MTNFESLIKKYSLERYGQPLLEAEDRDVGGIDVLSSNQKSKIPEVSNSQSDDLKKVIYLSNILLKALKFKPSDEVVAYLLMPRFIELSNREKLITIKNLLIDHPEMIVQEAEGDDTEVSEEVPVGDTEEVVDFGQEEIGGDIELGESEELSLLNLIIRAFKMDPHSLPQTLKSLPMKANKDNYGEIIEKIESILI